jgi:hypothetical protein
MNNMTKQWLMKERQERERTNFHHKRIGKLYRD